MEEIDLEEKKDIGARPSAFTKLLRLCEVPCEVVESGDCKGLGGPPHAHPRTFCWHTRISFNCAANTSAVYSGGSQGVKRVALHVPFEKMLVCQ